MEPAARKTSTSQLTANARYERIGRKSSLLLVKRIDNLVRVSAALDVDPLGSVILGKIDPWPGVVVHIDR